MRLIQALRKAAVSMGVVWAASCSQGGAKTTASPDGKHNLVEISARDCKARGLPSATLTVRGDKGAYQARTFPDKGVYAVVSGPPGGPSGLTLRVAPEGDLAAALRALGHEEIQSGTVMWQGRAAEAVASVHGRSQARAQMLHVLAPVPEGRIWLEIRASAGAAGAAPAELAAEEPFSAHLADVRVD